MGTGVLHPPDQTEYVVFLGKLSRLLLKWAQNGYSSWYGYDGVNQKMAKLAAQRIRVNDGPDALRLVDFLLRPTPCAPAAPRKWNILILASLFRHYVSKASTVVS